MNKTVLTYIEKLEGFLTGIKELHWDSKNLSQHKLCDEISERIGEFQDQVSEVEQSINGKLKVGKFNPIEYKVKDLKSFTIDVIDSAMSFLGDVKKLGKEYIGMASDCESFISDMQRNLYLVNFTLKEELKRDIQMQLTESRPKNLFGVDVDGVDKFIGRRPKTMKSRINQIYKIVKKYGIDSRLYKDDNWQAINDYFTAISSLGYEVDIKPCADLRHSESMMSDGGYTDYDETDHMPRSKQYSITISDEDTKIQGYIKCMAAGTIEDPFSRYDTCIILWPKNEREIKEGKNMEYVYDLTENELHGLVEESVKILLEKIDIDPKNKGKFTETQKETGKSTEELCHSKNPLTRKRANFARMAKRHFKPLKEDADGGWFASQKSRFEKLANYLKVKAPNAYEYLMAHKDEDGVLEDMWSLAQDL